MRSTLPSLPPPSSLTLRLTFLGTFTEAYPLRVLWSSPDSLSKTTSMCTAKPNRLNYSPFTPIAGVFHPSSLNASTRQAVNNLSERRCPLQLRRPSGGVQMAAERVQAGQVVSRREIKRRAQRDLSCTCTESPRFQFITRRPWFRAHSRCGEKTSPFTVFPRICPSSPPRKG